MSKNTKRRLQINEYENTLVGSVSNLLSSETPSQKMNRHLRLRSQLTQSELNIINKYI